MPRLIAAVLCFALSPVASAQECAPAAIITLPQFDDLARDDGRSPAQLRTAIEALGRPQDDETRWRLAQLQVSLMKAGDDSQLHNAVQYLAQIIQSRMGADSDPQAHPTTGDVLYRLGWALQHRGDMQRARQVFHRLIHQHPNHPRLGAAYLSFAEFYLREGDVGASVAFLQRAEPLSTGLTRAVVRYLSHLAGEAGAPNARALLRELQGLPGPQAVQYATHLRRHCRT